MKVYDDDGQEFHPDDTPRREEQRRGREPEPANTPDEIDLAALLGDSE